MSPSVSAAPASETVGHLLEMLSGDRPLAEADRWIDRDVVIHVDEAETHRGLALWKRWVHLMRERGRLRDLRFEARTMDVGGDVVRVTFHWSGTRRRGRDTTSAPTRNRVEYRVSGGRVAEIWTRKANYVDVFGPWILAASLDRSVAVYGAINVRSDGRRALVAQMLERRGPGGKKWDVYPLTPDTSGVLSYVSKHEDA